MGVLVAIAYKLISDFAVACWRHSAAFAKTGCPCTTEGDVVDFVAEMWMERRECGRLQIPAFLSREFSCGLPPRVNGA